MHVLCPTCDSRISISVGEEKEDIVCPSCKTRFVGQTPHRDEEVDRASEDVGEPLISADLSVVIDDDGDVSQKTAPRSDTVDEPGSSIEAGLRIKNFLLLRQIGEGGFGKVFEAFDTELEQPVAIKFALDEVSPREMERLVQEAKIAAQLRNCPNIVPVYEVGTFCGSPYIVSRFIDGKPLSALLKKKALSLDAGLEIVGKVAEALAIAAEKEIVHRDLKPANILIDRNNEPHIADFGLAIRDVYTHSPGNRVEIAGTYAYMSPEQAKGRISEIDHQTDVYGLGVILYETLTARRPFQGSKAEVLQAIFDENPVPPIELNSDVPQELSDFCLLALQKEKSRRPRVSLEFKYAIDEWRFRRLESSRRRRSRRRSLILAGGIGLSIPLFGATAWLTRSIWNPPPNVVGDGEIQVDVTTDPPNCQVAIAQENSYGQPSRDSVLIHQNRTPCSFRLSPGAYRVEVMSPDGATVNQVSRAVPPIDMIKGAQGVGNLYRYQVHPESDRRISWPTIFLPVRGALVELKQIPGGNFRNSRGEDTQVESFAMSIDSISLDEFDKVMRSRTSKQIRVPRNFDLDQGSWRPNASANFVSFDEAKDCAELMGLRLPTLDEWEYAMTNGGTSDFPSQNPTDYVDQEWKVGEPAVVSKHDVNRWGIRGLLSGVATWSDSNDPFVSEMPPEIRSRMSGYRLVVGASWNVFDGIQPPTDIRKWPSRYYLAVPLTGYEKKLGKYLGIRCVKQLAPQFLQTG